jgi:glycosyltransferase involved in cell wall biosynthesis
VKAWLRFAGKGEQKVLAVFGVSPQGCEQAVRYLRRQLPDIPVWLFCTATPLPDTVAQCERVVVESDSMALVVLAEKELWPRWVVLSVATWTGGHGRWPVKLAPFLVPPFRALIMNERPDFFAPRPAMLAKHLRRRMRDALHAGWNRIQDVNRGLWLQLFAWLAQWSSPLSRRMFHEHHGTEPMSVHVPSPDRSVPSRDRKEAVATFRHAARKWNRAELDRLIQNSIARYLLLLEGDTEDQLEDMLPLFDDERTFAVARQTNFRDWKPMLFATAPFRSLQPGTASQTLAPVSTAILFDREKLQRLGGIPDTVVPGSALYIIFWKAAAAGWRSYTGGGTQVLEEAPDWPYEEAEFVVRVLSDASLKRLGPQEPDLSRGSISFQIRTTRPWPTDRPRILVVSPYLPYPLSHGGAVRIYNLCRALCDRVDFVLACFREKDDFTHFDKLHEIFREVYVVDRDEKASRDTTLPVQVREHVSASMRALIADICRSRRIDLLQIEYTHLAAFRDAAPDTAAILVEHDLTFTLYQQLGARAEYERWLAFERHWLRHYDGVWTMSSEDRSRAVAEGSPDDRTFVVANGVDIERFVPSDEPAEAPELFYVGSFRHLPNILGFERLWHEVMPLVWQRCPEARLRVVAGPDHHRYWREFLRRDYPASFDPRIVVHGFVEDLRPLYARATLVLAPLLVSAGTNIKVMEAMACRKAVVSTPIGCAGLGLVDGHDAVVREGTAAFAAAVCELLDDAARREEIAAHARRTVEERFSWRAIAEQAYASYRKLSGVPAR